MTKKVLALLMVFVMSVGLLTGCGGSKDAKPTQQDGKDKKMHVGVTMASMEFTFVTYLVEGMKDWEKKNPDVKVTYQDAKNDSSVQLSQVETFIQEKVDAIIILTVDAKTTKPIIEKCKAAGIPVIALNRKFDNPTVFVGADARLAGQIQGELLAKLAGGKGNVGIMNGIMGQENQVVRREGLVEALKKSPDMKVVIEGAADWKREKALEVGENWLQSDKNVTVIAAQSGEIAIGASKAVKAAGKKDKILIGGIDGMKTDLEAVKNGDIDVTVFQNPHEQGRVSLDAAVKLKKGEKVEPVIYVPFEGVTKENVDKYLAYYKK